MTGVATLCLTLAACDSGPGNTGMDTMTIRGAVTSEATAMKDKAGVDDAAVQSREVRDDGTTSASDGETRTDSEGRFALETETDAEFVLLSAVKGDFESRVVVDVRAASGSTAGAATMSGETRGEADVFLEARQRGAEHVSLAEAAIWVSASTAAQMKAGSISSRTVAEAVIEAEAAERAFLSTEAGYSSAMLAAMDEREERAYRSFQARIEGSLDSEVNAAAYAELREESVNSGDDEVNDARAGEARRAALVSASAGLNADVRFELAKSAEIAAAVSASAAVEHSFSEMGSGRSSAMADAGATLVAQLESAQSESEVNAAWQSFGATIEAEIAAELAIQPITLSLALESLSGLRATLQSSLASASSAEAIAQAKGEFFTGAEAALSATLGGDSRAQAGAQVLALVASR